MAIARTTTHTETYTRMELIKLQVERVLVRSAFSATDVAAIIRGVENRWITEISIYGLDADGDCHAELFVKIDWSRNALHMAAGRDTVHVEDTGWPDGVSTEIDLALRKFEMFAGELDLRRIFHVRYGAGTDRDETNRRLGFQRAKRVRWRDGTVGTVMSIPELDEVSVGINAAGGS